MATFFWQVIGVAPNVGTTTCIGAVTASGGMAGAGIHVTPCFGLVIGIASVATSTGLCGHTATATNVVGAGWMVGSSAPCGLSLSDGIGCYEDNSCTDSCL